MYSNIGGWENQQKHLRTKIINRESW